MGSRPPRPADGWLTTIRHFYQKTAKGTHVFLIWWLIKCGRAERLDSVKLYFQCLSILHSWIEREVVNKTKATFQRLNVVNINIKTTSKLTMCQLFLYTNQFLKMLSSVQTTSDFLSFYLLFDCECESIFLLVAKWLVNQGPRLTHHHYQCLQEVDKTQNVNFLPDSGHWKGSYRVKVLARNTVS